jgi:uncharacterized protein
MILTKDAHPELACYSGELLHKRFAYRYFKDKVLPQGNIIAYRAPARVEAEGMIDLEDVLNNDFIYSQDMMHFMYEVPILSDKFGAVAFQRLFNAMVANLLSANYIKAPIEMKGDDMIVHKPFIQRDIKQDKGKASVSIVHVKDGAALGHTGINNVAGDLAPVFAYSCGMNDDMVHQFMSEACNMFYAMVEDIFVATTKIIS